MDWPTDWLTDKLTDWQLMYRITDNLHRCQLLKIWNLKLSNLNFITTPLVKFFNWPLLCSLFPLTRSHLNGAHNPKKEKTENLIIFLWTWNFILYQWDISRESSQVSLMYWVSMSEFAEGLINCLTEYLTDLSAYWWLIDLLTRTAKPNTCPYNNFQLFFGKKEPCSQCVGFITAKSALQSSFLCFLVLMLT